jgi:RNA polymerase sigma-70 factor (ECF subfamily)
MATALPFDQLGWRLQLSLAADEDSEAKGVLAFVAAARAGDLEAFDRLMQLEERRVYRTALHLLSRPEDAEDAVQETFLRVHRALARYDVNRSWRPWLYAIALNVCRDIGRKRRMQAWVSLDAWKEAGGSDPAAPEPAPDEAADAQGRLRILQQGMKRLTAREREALTLHAIEELPAAESAAILGVAEGTVRSLASRARAKLSEYVESRLGGRR